MPHNLQISIFTGHFGSGKTEIAINYSINMAQKGIKTVLVDLDIINPFFRSTEAKAILEKNNIELISPTFATTNVDLPSLPPTIYSVFERNDTHVIFDLGGDEDGASVLGRFFPKFKANSYKMYLVVNTCRPFTKNTAEIIVMAKNIEKYSRLKITGLINNTNLSYETVPEIIINAQKYVREASKKLNVPITFITAESKILRQLPKDYQKMGFPLERYMKPMWER